MQTGFEQLVLLNMLLHGQEDIAQSIAKQRLVFFIKHVLTWLEDVKQPAPLRAELCRAFSILLPFMSDLYGEHWEAILRSMATSWSATEELREDEDTFNK